MTGNLEVPFRVARPWDYAISQRIFAIAMVLLLATGVSIR
jgi:hypothetical protein